MSKLNEVVRRYYYPFNFNNIDSICSLRLLYVKYVRCQWNGMVEWFPVTVNDRIAEICQFLHSVGKIDGFFFIRFERRRFTKGVSPEL